MKKAMYVIACVVVLVTNNGSNAFRKGMLAKELTTVTITVED